MNTGLSYLTLALRVALAWWVLLVVLTAVVSGPFAMLGALLLFPPLAMAVGCLAAWSQYRAQTSMSSDTSPLAVGQSQSISLALPTIQAMKIARSAVEAVFGQVDQRVTENSITARVIEIGLKPTGLAALRSDQMRIVVGENGSGRSTLQIVCEPSHAWLYGLFWVEAGRSARQVDALRKSILARVRAQSEVADSLVRQNALQFRLAQAELLLLRAQIEPHFLFNTLAHIRASVEANPQAAQAMLDALIGFLRANSQATSSASTSLAAELQRVDSYLKIMQIRLGERLRYSIGCDPSLLPLQVPTACVLIFAENAVKHGIERTDVPGMISVNCQKLDDVIAIDVDNDGPGLATRQDTGAGGLTNLRERLQLTYGANAQMSIEGRDEGGVRASLRIPAIGRAHDV